MFALLAALVFFVGVAIVVFADTLTNESLWVVLLGGLGLWTLHIAFPIKLTQPGKRR